MYQFGQVFHTVRQLPTKEAVIGQKYICTWHFWGCCFIFYIGASVSNKNHTHVNDDKQT
jgi:hypothetical protein